MNPQDFHLPCLWFGYTQQCVKYSLTKYKEAPELFKAGCLYYGERKKTVGSLRIEKWLMTNAFTTWLQCTQSAMPSLTSIRVTQFAYCIWVKLTTITC